MKANRIFWPQELMDQWLVDEKIALEGDRLTIKEENSIYIVNQALFFEADVGDGGDAFNLVGRVKDLASLEEMGGEHYMDSVIIEDSAYKVIVGFTGIPLVDISSSSRRGVDFSDAFATHTGEEEKEDDDRELLAKFLIENL